MDKETRRPRGPSPRGDFERSKSVSASIIEARRQAERNKSATLKEARLKLAAGSSGKENPERKD